MSETCEAKTNKKAWNNPLAPMARCAKEAKVEIEDWQKHKRRVCNVHAKKGSGQSFICFWCKGISFCSCKGPRP